MLLDQRACLFARAPMLRGILRVGRDANPHDQPAAKAMRRERGIVCRSLQQGIHVLSELAKLARLGVIDDQPSRGELQIDVDLALEQHHDAAHAGVHRGIAGLEHDQRADQARVGEKLVFGVIELKRSIAHAGKRIRMLAEPAVIAEAVPGDQQCRGRERSASQVAFLARCLQRSGERLQRSRFAAMRFLQTPPVQGAGSGSNLLMPLRTGHAGDCSGPAGWNTLARRSAVRLLCSPDTQRSHCHEQAQHDEPPFGKRWNLGRRTGRRRRCDASTTQC